MLRNTLLLIVLAIFYYSGYTQPIDSPLNIPLLLSGNFGELRTNHFHSGLDFKTQGRTGLPVLAVDDGYVARINVSPYGYGRALYIEHPDGITSVYGHLDRYSPAIEAFVEDNQYREQKFRVDLYPTPGQFPVKKGQVVAYSGNTGGSGGPHLHFEIRDTKTEEILDPLIYFTGRIADTRSPKIREIMVYPFEGKGIVNESSTKVQVPIEVETNGDVIMSDIEAWGTIGVAVKAYDYMNETSNIYGVRYIQLEVDGQPIFSMDMDRFAFSESRYLNSYIDWEEWTYGKAFFMKSFIEPGNLLRACKAENQGWITIDEERYYKLVYRLGDIFGNTTNFEFYIRGKKQQIPEFRPRGTRYAYNRDNIIEVDGVRLEIPKGNLYTDFYFTYSRKDQYTPFASLYSLHKRMPLHDYCPVRIPITQDTFHDKSKYGVISVNDGKVSWIGGQYENGYMQASIRELGAFSVNIDTSPPVVTAQNQANWKKTGTITFKITDNLSGIQDWHATIGGEFVLFEYDAKSNRLFYKTAGGRVKATTGKQLKLTVKDGVDNKTAVTFVLP